MSAVPEAAAFHAGHRLTELMLAGKLPADLLRQAALGRLTLGFPDRLLVLVYLAGRDSEAAATARATLDQIPAAEIARVLAMPECPQPIRDFFCLGAAAPPPEATEADGGFVLVEASEDERAELATVQGEQREARSILQRLAVMSVQERVRCAAFGSREERMILIRDASRVVQRGVLASPRLTEHDVELIAAMRNVDENVLREIGGSRRWLRSLNIIRNLVNNSRTPTDLALQLCKHLFPNDLRRLMLNHNVPDAVRRGASRLLAQKES